MPDNTFDIVSKIDLSEVNNAVQQALKEITTRFDLKDSHSNIELNEKDNKLVLTSADDYRLKAVRDILEGKLVKRHVPLKGLSYGTHRSCRSLDCSPGSHAAAGYLDRESPRNRQADQRQQEEGAGFYSGRSDPHQRQGSRYFAGDHQPAPGARLRYRYAVHELPIELSTAECLEGLNPICSRALPGSSKHSSKNPSTA